MFRRADINKSRKRDANEKSRERNAFTYLYFCIFHQIQCNFTQSRSRLQFKRDECILCVLKY